MKKSKILLLAALPAAILAANVQAAPEVYGKLNVSLQQETQDAGGTNTQDNWKLESNASRFGIKGSADLGSSGLKGVYKLEYGTAVDSGDAELTSRNSYVGVQGDFGTVIAGKFDSPTKEAQGKVDLFNDYLWADITSVITGENRPSNIMMYSAPKMGGVALNVAVMPGEQSGQAANEHNDGPADAVSASAVYDTDSLYLAAAVDSDVAEGTSAVQKNSIRLVGQFKVTSDIAIGAILQSSENVNEGTDGQADQQGVIISASFTAGDNVFKLQAGASDTDIGAADDTQVRSWTGGIDHMLGKDAKVYAYYTDWSSDAGGPQSDKTTAGIGFEQKF